MWNQNELMADSIIGTFKSLDSLEEQLKYVLVLMYQLKSDAQKKFQDEIEQFEEYFSDIDFMRRVRHRDSLVKDYPSEYFGRNYGRDDPFFYDREIEKKINDISMEIMACLGLVVKSLKEVTFYLDDDMEE